MIDSVAETAGRIMRGQGALVVLASLFLASGTLKLWNGATAAFAQTAVGPSEIAASCDCGSSAGLAAALSAVQDRAADLDARETALKDRMQALAVAETTITAKLEELREAEAQLAATMTRSESASEDDLLRLTAVYENMKPKEASEVFARMTPDFAAGFLGRMRADAAAAIMSGLEPETAYAISVLLAGRNANAPVE